MSFSNVYEDPDRAASYARLEFPGTYYLAYRDLPEILGDGAGRLALDFGCGTGRSTRFIAGLGFDVVGVDIATEMLEQARQIDPGGDYRLALDGDLTRLGSERFDVVVAVFTFDNIPGLDRKVSILEQLAERLEAKGRIVILVSSPDIYTNEWSSFTTSAFPENRDAKSGDLVRIVMRDVEDGRAVEDVVCTDEDYRTVFADAGLRVVDVAQPLGRDDEPFDWISEIEIAAWTIYALEK